MNQHYDTIIIDDSSKSIDILNDDLQCHDSINVVATTTDIDEAKQLIVQHRPRVLFIDIEMPQQNGLDFIARIREHTDHEMLIIFYSAFQKYAIDAMRLSAFDFLQKPYFPDELADIVRRIDDYYTSIDDTRQRTATYATPASIGLLTDEGLRVVNRDDIVMFRYLAKERVWQMLHADTKAFTLRKGLTARDLTAIDEALLVQLSQNCIVNLRYVSSIDTQTMQCRLAPPFDDMTLAVSRTYYPKFKDHLHII